MDQNALIKALGEQLDNDVFPSVRIGGVLVPATFDGTNLQAGKENRDGGPRRSPAGSREGAAGWQGSSGGSPDPSASSVGEELRRSYEAQLDAVLGAYPGTKVWRREDGMWLLTPSAVLDGLRRAATFLVFLPYIRGAAPQGWGFWRTGQRWAWIGPRHTNFPAGSICAFTEEDGTWLPGGDLVTLLDLYTLWAFRHLHVDKFGRWPGYHSARHPYERVVEFRGDEFCGCGSEGLRYSECCMGADYLQDPIKLAADFRKEFGCGLNERRVPASVLAVVAKQKDPPTALSLLLAE